MARAESADPFAGGVYVVHAQTATTAKAATLSRTVICGRALILISQRKHKQHSAPTSPASKIRERRSPLANIVRKIGRYVAGDEQSHVPADTGINRDILISVRPEIRDRISDDSRANLEFPENR